MHHTVSENLFSNAVSDNDESANVAAEYSKGADRNGTESSVRGGVRCCRLWFQMTVRRARIKVFSSVNVAVHCPKECVVIPLVAFSCADQISVCGLEDTVHSAKKVFFCLLVRGQPGSDRIGKA